MAPPPSKAKAPPAEGKCAHAVPLAAAALGLAAGAALASAMGRARRRGKKPGGGRVFLSPPDMQGRERELLMDAFDSNWIAPLGPHVNAFEKEIAAATDTSHALALSSGTAALHLGLIVLGVEPGDYVLVSTATFAATANAIKYCGAVPVFVDSEQDTWNMDTGLLDEALTVLAARGTPAKAVIVVDLYGQLAKYEKITPVCERHNVPILEDAAEALGATRDGKKAGSFGALAALSFNGNKIITTSGGGMLVGNDKELVERARHLSTQAREPVPHYLHKSVGYNYRMSNLLAAVGRGQLEMLEQKIKCRATHFRACAKAFAGVPGVRMMPLDTAGSPNYWLTCVMIDAREFGATSAEICAKLGEQQIEARALWMPMHMQPVFEHVESFGGAVARSLFENGMCLPSGSSLTARDRQRVIDAILKLHTPRPMNGKARSPARSPMPNGMNGKH